MVNSLWAVVVKCGDNSGSIVANGFVSPADAREWVREWGPVEAPGSRLEVVQE